MLKVYEKNYSFDTELTEYPNSFAKALEKIIDEINTSESIYGIIHIENEKKFRVSTTIRNFSYVEQIGGKAVVLVDVKDA